VVVIVVVIVIVVVVGSSRQGCNPVGASPTVPIARFGYVAMPLLGGSNPPSSAWCIRPRGPVQESGMAKTRRHRSRCNQGVEQVWEPEHQ